MTSKPLPKFLMLTITIWIVSAVVGCSALTPVPAPTAMATGTVISTKTPVPSATITSTPEPSPTPYNGPNILFYIQNDQKLFSVYADGGNQREIAQGVQFSFSPNKKKLVYRTAETFFSNDDEVIVLDLSQEEIIYRWNIPGYCEGVFTSSEFVWSPDSQRIAFTLTRYDGADPAQNCELEYDYEDMGIYQIDLASTKISHPPLIDTFLNYPYVAVLYSPDGSKLRLGPRGAAFDTKTWERVSSEPFYDLLQLCEQPEKIGVGDSSNLCLYSRNDQISKCLTDYPKSWEGIETFKLFSNCSAVVYKTQDKKLHVMSLSSESDQLIGRDIWTYILTPDNNKIVFYDRDEFTGERSIFVVNNDGSAKHSIAKFTRSNSPIFGASLVISPTGKQIAFVNSEGIAVADLDGDNLVQVVNFPDVAPTDRVSLKILDWQ